MKGIHRAAISGVLILGVCAACNSSGSDPTGATNITALDSGRQLSSLSDTEATGYCHDLQNYFTSSLSPGEMKEVGCVIVASFAQLAPDLQTARSECVQIYDACVASDAGSTLDAGSSSDTCATAKSSFANCPATVGEVNACEIDEVAYEKNFLGKGSFFCQELVATDAGIAYEQTDLPASCVSLQAKCPNAMKPANGK
ncbi:MAG TPA: hypothetical protein VNO21_09800 [Polyangiaceae bacterium]|nr:hypothetical protein [Polyangiaceae bacterium]